MSPIIKYQVKKEKTRLLHKGETTAIGKSFIGKSKKYFSVYQYQTFRKFRHSISARERNRFIQETKKDSKKRYSKEFQKHSSGVVLWGKKSLKNSLKNSACTGTSVLL